MEFSVIGQGDPFLHVKLRKGEKLYCESDAMVTMDTTLDLTGKMQGGILSSLARKMANGESFFTQSIEAIRGDGDTLLSPELPGDLKILDCGGNRQYFLNDGAFLASEASVQMNVKTQNIGQALFGGSGGFFVTQTAGSGQLAVSGFGTMMDLEITDSNPMIVDNYHVVAWDDNLRYDISLSTQKGGGLMGNIVNSLTSGEGIVTKFQGNGKVYVCSRNRGSFVAWMASQMGTHKR